MQSLACSGIGKDNATATNNVSLKQQKMSCFSLTDGSHILLVFKNVGIFAINLLLFLPVSSNISCNSTLRGPSVKLQCVNHQCRYFTKLKVSLLAGDKLFDMCF